MCLVARCRCRCRFVYWVYECQSTCFVNHNVQCVHWIFHWNETDPYQCIASGEPTTILTFRILHFCNIILDRWNEKCLFVEIKWIVGCSKCWVLSQAFIDWFFICPFFHYRINSIKRSYRIYSTQWITIKIKSEK